MSANIGPLDRMLRVIVGMALIGLALWDSTYVWGFIGIVPLVTALIRFCPIYRLLGICSLKKAQG
ncbi:DUF2892 domain-containing protein [Pelagibius sp. Alg239-R121]|uniref:YgaP family membrane protein n=1 Tax=Pelagibius sp. Alg239-R121 TaxID=2993448 RepID=UPI0024A64CF7|nr:DUF2892 domain-containing protein [Pelagibius sp. Alg239-R121]